MWFIIFLFLCWSSGWSSSWAASQHKCEFNNWVRYKRKDLLKASFSFCRLIGVSLHIPAVYFIPRWAIMVEEKCHGNIRSSEGAISHYSFNGNAYASQYLFMITWHVSKRQGRDWDGKNWNLRSVSTSLLLCLIWCEFQPPQIWNFLWVILLFFQRKHSIEMGTGKWHFILFTIHTQSSSAQILWRVCCVEDDDQNFKIAESSIPSPIYAVNSQWPLF